MPIADIEERREYQRKWIAARRQEWFKDKCCIDCGSTDRLELDHVDPEIKVTNSVWSWSKKRRETELAKCVPRCHDCHAKRSSSQFKEWYSKPTTHGTISAYLKRKCKCDICVAFYKVWRRDKYLRIGK